MKAKKHADYLTPRCEVLEIELRQVFAASPDVSNTGVTNPFGSLFNPEENW